MLLACIRSYLKSVLRYYHLILDTYHPNTLHLREQVYEDPCILFKAKRAPRVTVFGRHWFTLWSEFRRLAFRLILFSVGIRQTLQLVEVSQYQWSSCCIRHWAVRSSLYYWHSEDWCGVVTSGRFSEVWAFDKELVECWSTRAGQIKVKIIGMTRTKATGK
jgi:hypothetical protein